MNEVSGFAGSSQFEPGRPAFNLRAIISLIESPKIPNTNFKDNTHHFITNSSQLTGISLLTFFPSGFRPSSASPLLDFARILVFPLISKTPSAVRVFSRFCSVPPREPEAGREGQLLVHRPLLLRPERRPLYSRTAGGAVLDLV